MSNGTQSVPPTPPKNGPVDVHEARYQQAVQEAVEKGKELVKDVSDAAMQQQGPPGTPSLRKKK
jgi:hypothetical protein